MSQIELFNHFLYLKPLNCAIDIKLLLLDSSA